MRIGIDENSGTYIFTPGVSGSGTIQIVDLPFNMAQNQLQIIYNTTDNVPLYNFALSTLTASVSDNIITLNIDTSSMSASDSLLIQIAEAKDDIKNKNILFYLDKIFNYISGFPWVDKTANQVRAQVTGTISTVTTVTTCATVTNVVGIDSMQGADFVRMNSKMAWNALVRGRIS
jgi:hypothetical protein